MLSKVNHGAAGPGSQSRLDSIAETLLQARLLFSSYAPLNAILFWRVGGDGRYVFALLALLGLLDAARLTWLAGRITGSPRTFAAVRDQGAEVAAYLATYLLPFLAAPHATARDVVGYAIYAGVVVLITLRSSLGAVNPTIYLLGWKLVSVTSVDGREQLLVCKVTPRPNEPIQVKALLGVLHAH